MKKRLNFNHFLIMSLAVHLGIASGVGTWIIPYMKNFNLGEDKGKVILLEIGWSKEEPKLFSANRLVEKKEVKRPIKIKEELKKDKKVVQQAKTYLQQAGISQKASSSLGQKSGRSGKERITLLSGNNSYLEEVRRRIEKVKFYPPQAKMARLEGEVTLEFQIDRLGRAQNINLTQLSKHKALNLAARKILAKASPFPKPRDSSIIDKAIETTLVFELTY